MADTSKAQKLKSSKKRYKELLEEQKRRKNQQNIPQPEENFSQEIPVNNPEINERQNTVHSPLNNYFSNVQPTAFFDSIVDKKGEETNAFTAYIQPENTNNSSETTISNDNLIEINSEVTNGDYTEVKQSNVENLTQLSDQISELINPNLEFHQFNSITDLEKRNLELAASLEQEKIKVQQLTQENSDLSIKITKFSQNLTEDTESRLNQEIVHLKEDLQTHIQTIGLLVAEKAELSANLGHFELISKQKSAECEELQARLKANRSRVADLEREIAHIKSEKTRIDQLERDQIDQVEKLKIDYENLKELKEELNQDRLEALEKLKKADKSITELQEKVESLSNQLSMANLKIQQLTAGEISENDEVDKFKLEKQIEMLNQTIKSITKERDESTTQQQHYAQQLNAQVTNLWQKIEELQLENENLHQQEQNRIRHIGELERQLQNLQTEHVNYSMQKTGNQEQLKIDLDKTRELYIQLGEENNKLNESYTKVSNENDLLLKEIEAKNDSIAHLESLIEQLRGNQPDSVKLLATMESDKVAAARAVAQNVELKRQMESMQEVFVKVNNDKVELTEKLTTEQNISKELMEKLQKTEISLQTLAEAIEIKDRELSSLRENSEELNKQILQQDQLNDRLRHYEAQDNSSHVLQTELQDAKQTIVKLTNEINQLKLHKSQQQNGVEEINHNNEDEIDKLAAMHHLEEKVKRTMDDIAKLTEEKHRLEHLVLQLQSETETIGEYVALYQHQRGILKQRALEKDKQLKQLAADREEMKEKLQKLNDLVAKLVKDNNIDTKELLQTANDNQSEETAEKIVNLLTEIKTSNLMQSNEGIHHCACCSGQLITV